MSYLRTQIAILLAASGALGVLASACGGKVFVDPPGSGGSGGGLTSSSGGTDPLPPTCESGEPNKECMSPPPDGTAPFDCPAASEVEDGCCNAATKGPFAEGGLCCYWWCPGACCGRAFTVGGEARVAEVVSRQGWLASSEHRPIAHLDEPTRAALAEAWLADAQMEHASVASFARFTLELLALGAPSDLVEASQRASMDEVEHARLCFGIASRFAGRAMGPAPLAMEGAMRGGSLAESAAWAVEEGCIGETIAAMTAHAQRDVAEDEGVRAALDRIADDEERHAMFAWRFVAWALTTGDASVHAAVMSAFSRVQCYLQRDADEANEGEINTALYHRYGRLTRAEADQAARSALRDVIEPCVRLLTGPSRQPLFDVAVV